MKHNEFFFQKEWRRQKNQKNTQNSAIDKIMLMINLKNIKVQILRIKTKIDTSIR
jgi:hypothetical protein